LLELISQAGAQCTFAALWQREAYDPRVAPNRRTLTERCIEEGKGRGHRAKAYQTARAAKIPTLAFRGEQIPAWSSTRRMDFSAGPCARVMPRAYARRIGLIDEHTWAAAQTGVDIATTRSFR